MNKGPGTRGFGSAGRIRGVSRRPAAAASTLTRLLLATFLFSFLLPPRPAESVDVSVVGELTREAGLLPGGRSEGIIRVRNAGKYPAEVRIYQTDYSSVADGRNLYASPGSIRRSNASWIVFTPERLTIAAGEEGSVSYAVQVPGSDSLSGTYWSMLMVEPQPDAAGPLASTTAPHVGIRTIYRQAVQLVTNVGNGGTRDLHVLASQVFCDAGKRLFRWDVENRGTIWLRPVVYADLYGEDGRPVGRVDNGRGRLYPGCSIRFDLDMSRFPTGKYTALVIADCGDDQVFGARYGLDLDVDCSGPVAAKPE